MANKNSKSTNKNNVQKNNNKNTKKNNSSKKYVSNNNKYISKTKVDSKYSRADVKDKKGEEIDLDATINLDTSFMDKYKPVKTKKMKYEKVEMPKKERPYIKFYLWILFLVLCVISLGSFIVYHYITFDHKSCGKVITKTKIVEDTKVDNNYLFLGDSITEFYDLEKYYKDFPVVNSGVCGNTTEDILNNMNNRVYKYNPSKVFILIGTNDFVKDIEMDDTVENIKKIVDNIKENRPYCKIYLESILPINNTDDDKIDMSVVDTKRSNSKIMKINKKLEKLASEEDTVYIDVYNNLLDDDGNLDLDYTVEGLHLSNDGYEVVTDILKKYIEE